MQRYNCKDCGKTFSENYGDSLRYSHLTSDEWFDIIRGIVNNHSLPQIARNCGISKSTAWSCRMKINQAIMTMYGYSDLFQGTTQADVIIESELHTAGAYSLSRINSLHSSIERFFCSKEYLPATKYIDLYLKMFWWLQKNKDLSSNELTSILFRLVTGYVDNTARAKMTRTTIKDLVTRELPIDTKGFY